jgi:hypothetical protein
MARVICWRDGQPEKPAMSTKNWETGMRLDVRQYESVELLSGADGRFLIETRDRLSAPRLYHARKVIYRDRIL